MPTYDYECPGCANRFEVFESIRANRRKSCPECGAAGARRLIGSGAGLIFRGSGFYITDSQPKRAETTKKKN